MAWPKESAPRKLSLLHPQRWFRPAAWILLGVFLWAALGGTSLLKRSAPQVASSLYSTPHTLVVYVHKKTHSFAESNFKLFLQEISKGVPAPHVVYEFIVATEKGALPPDMRHLPRLPPKSRVRGTALDCNAFGLFGWLLGMEQKYMREFSYFMLLSSAVCGPFIPPYAQSLMHWTQPYIEKLNSNVKLVGSTITCGTSNFPTTADDKKPHVQRHVLAMDRESMDVIFMSGALECRSTDSEDILYGELAVSQTILDHGYNIDSLMMRYQGVDWTDKRFWGCNGGLDPVVWGVDGVALQSTEVMFIPMADADWTFYGQASHNALVYSGWFSGSRSGKIPHSKVVSNRFLHEVHEFLSETRGRCFDAEFYLVKSPDVAGAVGGSYEAGTDHFLNYGLHEGRPFRLKCLPLPRNWNS